MILPSSHLNSSPQMEISHSQKAACVLTFLLIVSLPFFSVRNPTLQYSPPLLMLMIIAVFSSLRCLLLGKLTIDYLDLLLLGFLGMVLVNCAILPPSENRSIILTKSFVYFALFAAFKQLITGIPLDSLQKVIFRGVVAGSFCFLGVALFCLWRTGNLGILTSKLGYHTFTVQLFASIDSVIGATASGRIHIQRCNEERCRRGLCCLLHNDNGLQQIPVSRLAANTSGFKRFVYHLHFFATSFLCSCDRHNFGDQA